MKPETMKKIGWAIIAGGMVSGIIGVQTDDARMKARSRKNVTDPKPRELFKEDCASEKTTNAMTWGGAIAMLAGIGIVEAAKKKSR